MAHYEGLTPDQIKKEKHKVIWRTAAILAVITGIEFLFAFTIGRDLLWVKNTIFIVLTIVKAFYIVAEFMHLRHEAKMLISAILFPILFIIWLITALLMEGSFIYQALPF